MEESQTQSGVEYEAIRFLPDIYRNEYRKIENKHIFCALL